MSERKVLSKYYPPDFDPQVASRRRRTPKDTVSKGQSVRIAAPFTMRCTRCGEFIYRGRKFNARKETRPDESYLGVQVVRIHMRCTRCSSEITYRTDPKNNDYVMVSGAMRNSEPWRNREAEAETDEQRLDRLEREEAEAEGEADEERDAMAALEATNEGVMREMAAANELDALRRRNARIQMAEKEGVDVAAGALRAEEEERRRKLQEDEEAEFQASIKAARERFRLEEEEREAKEEEERRKADNIDWGVVPRKRKREAGPRIPGVKIKTKMPDEEKGKQEPEKKPPQKAGPLVEYSDSE